MAGDARIPELKYLPPSEPPQAERRRAFTLSRELDRITGEIETREAAQAKYHELGLRTPEALDYYDG